MSWLRVLLDAYQTVQIFVDVPCFSFHLTLNPKIFWLGVQHIPGWWIWYYWFCPLAWTVYGLVASQYGDLTNTFVTIVGQEGTQTVAAYIKSQYGYEHKFLPVVGPMLVVWVLLFGGIFIYAIKFLNFQRR